MSDFKGTGAQGDNLFYFRVGTRKVADEWSEVFTLNVVVCGQEKIEARAIPVALNFVFAKGDNIKG